MRLLHERWRNNKRWTIQMGRRTTRCKCLDLDKVEQGIRLKAQYHLLSDVILRLRNNIITMYFDRYLSFFGIKIQIILANLFP